MWPPISHNLCLMCSTDRDSIVWSGRCQNTALIVSLSCFAHQRCRVTSYFLTRVQSVHACWRSNGFFRMCSCAAFKQKMHQSPFVGASSSVCQGPGHRDQKHFHCDLSNMDEVRKPLVPDSALLVVAHRSTQNEHHKHVEKTLCVHVNVIKHIWFWNRYCHHNLNLHLVLNQRNVLLHVYIYSLTSLQLLFISFRDLRGDRPVFFVLLQTHI